MRHTEKGCARLQLTEPRLVQSQVLARTASLHTPMHSASTAREAKWCQEPVSLHTSVPSTTSFYNEIDIPLQICTLCGSAMRSALLHFGIIRQAGETVHDCCNERLWTCKCALFTLNRLPRKFGPDLRFWLCVKG